MNAAFSGNLKHDEDTNPLLNHHEASSPLHIARVAVSPPQEQPTPIPNHKSKKIYMVVIFCITAGLLYADQNLLAPNLTAIAESFGFNDEERDKYLGGYIAAAFYLVGAPSALLFGYLSDTVNRRNLLFIAVCCNTWTT